MALGIGEIPDTLASGDVHLQGAVRRHGLVDQAKMLTLGLLADQGMPHLLCEGGPTLLAEVVAAGRSLRPVLLTLFVNWCVKPFTMYAISLFFLGVAFRGFIGPDAVAEGAVVVDVGINRLPDGRLTGDIDFATAAKRAAWISPVPGGVGPMTRSMLMLNTAEAAGLEPAPLHLGARRVDEALVERFLVHWRARRS